MGILYCMNVVRVKQKKTALIFLKRGFLKTKYQRRWKKKEERERDKDRETEKWRKKLAKTLDMPEVCIKLIESKIMKYYELHHSKNMNYFLMILETRLLRQRWQQSWFLLEPVFSACRWLVSLYILTRSFLRARGSQSFSVYSNISLSSWCQSIPQHNCNLTEFFKVPVSIHSFVLGTALLLQHINSWNLQFSLQHWKKLPTPSRR